MNVNGILFCFVTHGVKRLFVNLQIYQIDIKV